MLTLHVTHIANMFVTNRVCNTLEIFRHTGHSTVVQGQPATGVAGMPTVCTHTTLIESLGVKTR